MLTVVKAVVEEESGPHLGQLLFRGDGADNESFQ